MASSESDNDVVITSLHLLTSIVQEKHELNQRDKKIWQHEWISKSSQYGAYHGLVCEIRDTDPATYRNFIRMDDGSFTILLQGVAPSIQRQDTALRKAIPPEERLALTVRYLATGTHHSKAHIIYYVPRLRSVASRNPELYNVRTLDVGMANKPQQIWMQIC